MTYVPAKIDGETVERQRVALRDSVKPYAIIRTKDGQHVEIMSFPFNEDNSPTFVVFARRTIGDPMSAEYIRVDTLDI